MWASMCHEPHLEQYMPSADRKIFDDSSLNFLQMWRIKTPIHGINFHQQLANLTTFVEVNYVGHCGLPLMRLCVHGNIEDSPWRIFKNFIYCLGARAIR